MSQRALFSCSHTWSASTTGCPKSTAYATVDVIPNRRKLKSSLCSRSWSSYTQLETPSSESNKVQISDALNGQKELAHRARRNQADRDLFTNLLSSAATKRDAKAYLSRLKSPQKQPAHSGEDASKRKQQEKAIFQPEVNVGNFFGRARAVDESPTFTQYANVQAHPTAEVEKLHVALVKLVHPENYSDDVLRGIAETLSQLSRLSMAPCVVVEPKSSNEEQFPDRLNSNKEADRLAAAIDAVHESGARKLDHIFAHSNNSQHCEVSMRHLLLRPLRKGQIPIVLALTYSSESQKAISISANDAIIALTREFAGLNLKPPLEGDPKRTAEALKLLQAQVSLDRIIIVDEEGGIPKSIGRRHVLLNLEQEFSDVCADLSTLQDRTACVHHMSNLQLLRDTLWLLPPLSSGLITSPGEAANISKNVEDNTNLSSVGTRRQKNALIHNLLTDKPAYSASLPSGRLGIPGDPVTHPVVSTSTFVKKGMPLTVLPNPGTSGWVPDNHGQSRLKLTDPRIDLPRLVHLIEDSFDRKLDVQHYLSRVNDNIAGIIIAGEYEGGALLTWETSPDRPSHDPARLVPYLDKFAVLKRSQGAGGVADILFNAMVRTCFPEGVCWRSRKNNPVNKWYFERSRGTWKLPETNWTMFWTTPEVVEHDELFRDYESICRNVQPSWADNKHIVD